MARDCVLDSEENEIVEAPDCPSEDRAMTLRRLRERWELASVLNFLHVFEPLTGMVTTFSAEEIESALIEPNDLLAQLHKTLLKGIPPVNKMLYERKDAWITILCKQIGMWWRWIAEGDIPLTVNKGEEVSRYKMLDPTIRLQILKALCEIRADQHDTVRYINDVLKDGTEISHFRKDKIGGENGTTYWYDGNEHVGYRLYKEEVKFESIRTIKKNSAAPPVVVWETLATNLEEFRKAVKNDFSNSGSKVEMAVGETIEAKVVPALEKLQKKKERAAKKQRQQERLFNGFHNSRIARSSRACRPVNYTFDDYDKAIKEAIEVTNKRQDTVTSKQEVEKRKKNASNAVSDSEPNPNNDSGSDVNNAKKNCKDFSDDKKNNTHSSASLYDEENKNGGKRNSTRNRQKQTGNIVVAKKLLRQRPSSNAALESVVVPNSEESL